MVDSTQDLPKDTDNPEPLPLSGSDDAQQTATQDPAPTPEQPKRNKRRTRAEVEAARAAGEARPKRDRPRAGKAVAADDFPDPPSDTHVNIALDPIDGKLTADAINKVAATKQIDDYITQELAKAGNRLVYDAEKEIMADSKAITAGEFHAPEVHIDYKAQAKARLKVYGKYATRAVEAAKLWPKEPTRYFDAVGKIFVDLTMGESRVDALRHDRHAVAELVISLLPKSTIELIDCSGITAL